MVPLVETAQRAYDFVMTNYENQTPEQRASRDRWGKLIENFLAEWQAREPLVGALVTGSRVIGTATPESDIDIHLILPDDVEWRERGNLRIDGLLVEYF